MEENKANKISFFKRVKWSIFNPENYELFASEKLGHAISYLALTILFFSLITAIGITYKFATTDLTQIPEINEALTAEMLKSIENIPKIELYGIFYLLAVVFLYSFYFIITMVDVLLLSVLGFITSRIAKVPLKYSAIVSISCYALTLSIILNAIYILINRFTGFEIKYFQIMYNGIGYIYVVTAILMIKTDLIKQQIEIAKLEEEQKKIREELERQEEEEKQKEEQKKREQEEGKKKKDKKEKKEKEPNAPEGSSAITQYDMCKSEAISSQDDN